MILICLLLMFSKCGCSQAPPKKTNCFPDYSTSGKYYCETSSDTDISPLTCTIANSISCQATHVRFISQNPKKIVYYIQISLTTYLKKLNVQIEKTSSNPRNILDSFELDYSFSFDVQPRIVCQSQIPPDAFSSKFRCTTLVTQSTYDISQFGDESNECSAQIVNYVHPSLPQSPSMPETLITPSITPLIKKEYTVTIKDTQSECGKSCQITVVIPDTGTNDKQIQHNLHHKTSCPAPQIFCDGHDSIKQEISCKFQIDYPFDHIKVNSKKTCFTVAPIKIPETDLTKNSVKEITLRYTVSDLNQDCSEIQLEFKIHQTETTAVHIIEQKFAYVLKNDEISSVVCEPSDEATTNIGASVYLCKTISKTDNVELQTATDGVSLVGTKPVKKANKGLKIYENYKVTITPTTITCNSVKTVEVKFSESGTDIKFPVTHYTVCPEPVIDCNDHNSIERQITCNLNIPYQADKLEITAPENKVTLTHPNPLEVLNPTKNTQVAQQINYEILDAKTADKSFRIEFKVIQSSNTVVTIVKNFLYKLKPSEIPSLSCVVKSPAAKDQNFQATKYSCNIISKEATIVIVTDDPKYRVTSGAITGMTETVGLQTKTDVEVTVTPNEIVCKKTDDVTFYFENDHQKYPFTVTHSTHCPEPIIEYLENDASTRTINLKITVKYPFEKILISSLHKSVNVLPAFIEYESDKTIYNQAITYTIVNLKEANHFFDVQLQFMQANNNEVYRDVQRFTYELRSNEIPGIHCIPSESSEFYKMKYSCRIISLSEEVSIQIDNLAKYTHDAVKVTGKNYFKIFKTDAVMVTISSKEQICNQHEMIKIYFEDSGKYENAVSHTTKCPVPIFDCRTSDIVGRKITCGIQVLFPFVKIKLTADPSNTITLTSNEIISADDIIKGKGDREISYSIENYANDVHKFSIEFEVEQKNTHVGYKTKRYFGYTLNRTEIPYIECSPDSQRTPGLSFSKSEYKCNMLSKSQTNAISTDAKGYTIDPQSVEGDSKKLVYIKVNFKITVDTTKIICGKDQIIPVSIGSEPIIVKTHVLHTTICPDPIFSNIILGDRSLTFSLTTPYAFTTLTLESDNTNVAITPSIPSTFPKTGETWTAACTVKFSPTDWSQDTHDIAIIAKVTLTEKSIKSKSTSIYKVDLKQEEKPGISCSPSKPENNFTLTEFTCNIISRKPKISLTSSQAKYVIIEERGNMIQENNVYKWKGYKVLLQDQRILCGDTVKVTISCKDSPVITKEFDITTTCPDPSINCKVHDLDLRRIICTIVSEFPYTQFVFRQTSTEKIEIEPPTEISFEGDGVYSSVHTISYEPTKLNDENRDFKIRFDVKQNSKSINQVEVEYTYKILPKEIQQIDCVEQNMTENQKVTIMKYSCYVVSNTQTPTIAFKDVPKTDYKLSYPVENEVQLKDRFKRENVLIDVEDLKMKCNRPTDLVLELTDGSDTYTTTISHTTKCDQIRGDCKVYVKESTTSVFCNFSSTQEFELKSFTCSELVICEKVNDFVESGGVGLHEYLIDFTPQSILSMVDFDLNVTLSYSPVSEVSFTYHLEYYWGGVEVQSRAAAASTGMIPSSMMLVAGIGIGFLVLMKIVTRKKKDVVVDYAT